MLYRLRNASSSGGFETSSGALVHSVLLLFLILLAALTAPQAATYDRPIDSVTVLGAEFPAFAGPSGGPEVERIHLYAWDSSAGQFEEIPFELAERKRWNLAKNLLDANFCQAAAGVIGQSTDICAVEESFTFEAEPGNDDFVGFDTRDAITFMARDAGPRAPFRPPSPALQQVADAYYEIRISDDRLVNQEMANFGEGFVYVFLWNVPQTRGYQQHYVEWEAKGESADSDRPQQVCETDDKIEQRGFKGCGWATPNVSASTGYADHATLEVRWLGNWTVNRLQYRAAGSTSSGDDVLDRYKLRLGESDGLIKEDERDWNDVNCPRFLGLRKYDPSSRRSPVRISRFSQGAQSGVATTRNDWYYGTHLHTRIRLRVHARVPNLRLHSDLVSGQTSSEVFNRDHLPNASPPDAADVVDGNGTASGSTPGSLEPDVGDVNWNLLETADGESLLFAIRETRALEFNPDTRLYYYDDEGTATTQPPEFEAGSYGNFGQRWPGESLDMQDLDCTDPPNNDRGLWREAEVFLIAVDAQYDYTDYLTWLEEPLDSSTLALSLVTNPPPGKPTPCPPSLVPSISNQGTRVDLTASAGCANPTDGFSFYRAVGAGAFRFVGHSNSGGAFTDHTIRPGVTYRYRAFARNEEGEFGPSSAIVSVAPADNENPPPPSQIAVEALQGGGRITWSNASVWDLAGNEIFASNFSGGPYMKLVTGMIDTSVQGYTVTGLDPSQTYCIVIRSIDRASNPSSYSDEVCFSPYY